MKLDFIVMGTQKGGTTALDNTLRLHPEVILPPKKELHYFDRNIVGWSLGLSNYLYHCMFYMGRLVKTNREDDFDSSKFIYGEITPIYMFWEPAHKRIKKYRPDIKMIFLLRDPVQRAFSHWAMEMKSGREHASFSEAIRNEWNTKDNILGCRNNDRYKSYVRRGLYFEQISGLLKHFNKEKMLFITSEDFRNNPHNSLGRITEFLKIKPCSIPPQIAHKGTYTEQLKKEDKDFLKNIYDGDIRQLRSELEIDVSNWL